MNSTVNYGYETQISAISAIDRDLKRVEDKADKALDLKDRIIRNEDHIECLAGKVICKDCEQKLENHKKSPHAHEELFDRTVNKQEGYGLISDAELEQIDFNQQDIAVLDGRVTANEERIEKTYTQDEVDALLAEKVDRGTPVEYPITFSEGFEELSTGYYSRSENNLVTGYFTLTTNEQDVFQRGVIDFGTLPKGYIPNSARPCPPATLTLNHAGVHSQFSANVYVHSSGYDPDAAHLMIHIPYDLTDVTKASGTFFYYVR